ncbi:MFS transporter [Shouchella clausii]|uniref:MFS transporter n=1 Tax=Shouchella clausii TaxID=79880 RepID=UPI000BA5BB59|nr:MFS transporter [Shouchella clausii]PAD91393.1 MFS transporter [Shouchella clausii]
MNRSLTYLLALGAFLTGTAEFIASGILEIIAADFGVSISAAGQLLTFYSLSYAFGALVLVLATAKYNRKNMLLLSLALFFVSNLIAFSSVNYWMLLTARIIMAMSGGLYIVIATHYASSLAAPQKRGNAMAIILTGFTLSLVVGVPIGTFASAYVDWRYTYLFLAFITFITLIFLMRLIPSREGNPGMPLKQQLRILSDKRLLTGLTVTILWILGYTLLFAYIAPFLSKTAHFSIEQISSALFILGLFALIGSRVGGFAVDRWGPVKTISISLMVHMLALISMFFVVNRPNLLVLTIMIWGAATWATTPANQYYLTSLKPRSSEIVLSFHTALMNIGMTLGAAFGGSVIASFPITYLTLIASLFVFLAFITATISFRLHHQERSRLRSGQDR